ncbi:hypothetical protein JL721_9591 [Aureococcus anophagefferens]|nr:hypothetical protein JL721_9591 [Aureococcus anophagefferens]
MLGARCAADEYRRRSRREPRCRSSGYGAALSRAPLLHNRSSRGRALRRGLARTFPRVAASIADAVAPLGAADFFFVFGGAQASAAPDAAWRGAFDRFPQIAQFVVDDTGGQLQKLQLCFGHAPRARPPLATVAMARSLPAQDRAERHLLAAWTSRWTSRAAEPSPTRSRCADFLAWTCRAYDAYLEAWAGTPRPKTPPAACSSTPAGGAAWDDGSAARRCGVCRRARHAVARSRASATPTRRRCATRPWASTARGRARGRALVAARRQRSRAVPRQRERPATRAAPGGGPGAAYAAELCARSFAPDVPRRPSTSAPPHGGGAGCSARLPARGGDLGAARSSANEKPR